MKRTASIFFSFGVLVGLGLATAAWAKDLVKIPTESLRMEGIERARIKYETSRYSRESMAETSDRNFELLANEAKIHRSALVQLQERLAKLETEVARLKAPAR